MTTYWLQQSVLQHPHTRLADRIWTDSKQFDDKQTAIEACSATMFNDGVAGPWQAVQRADGHADAVIWPPPGNGVVIAADSEGYTIDTDGSGRVWAPFAEWAVPDLIDGERVQVEASWEVKQRFAKMPANEVGGLAGYRDKDGV